MRVEAEVWVSKEEEDGVTLCGATLEFEEGPDEGDTSLHVRDSDGDVVVSITFDQFLRGWVAGQIAAVS